MLTGYVISEARFKNDNNEPYASRDTAVQTNIQTQGWHRSLCPHKA